MAKASSFARPLLLHDRRSHRFHGDVIGGMRSTAKNRRFVLPSIGQLRTLPGFWKIDTYSDGTPTYRDTRTARQPIGPRILSTGAVHIITVMLAGEH